MQKITQHLKEIQKKNYAAPEKFEEIDGTLQMLHED
jgi:hypothetical protein